MGAQRIEDGIDRHIARVVGDRLLPRTDNFDSVDGQFLRANIADAPGLAIEARETILRTVEHAHSGYRRGEPPAPFGEAGQRIALPRPIPRRGTPEHIAIARARAR